MTTRQENELLTRVGAGTPMGNLLRLYWWPVGISKDLKEKPTLIRLLGEDLVLFRNRDGDVGVLAALCAHRRANLCLGSVGYNGLRCRYHGWTYDLEGNIVETPGEPDETFKTTLKQTAYPAQELGGIIFTYLGPQPAPLLPRFDFLVGDGEREAKITGFANCNWLQCVENGMDPLHVGYTHAPTWSDLTDEPRMWFEENDWGVVYKAVRPRGEGLVNYREHHLILPGISTTGSNGRGVVNGRGPANSSRWSVPIDDTHAMMVRIAWKSAENPGHREGPAVVAGWKPIRIEPYREYKESLDNPVIGYTLPREVSAEDAGIMDSIGPIADRENEHLLPVGDIGMNLIRNMYLSAMKAVQEGRDPKGVIRDPARNQIIPVPADERDLSPEEMDRLRLLSPA